MVTARLGLHSLRGVAISMRTQLVYCPGCKSYERVKVTKTGYLCLVCRLEYTKAESERALDRTVMRVRSERLGFQG